MRITGGSLRGRPVDAPEGNGTRPTGDRAKVALFNILYGRLAGADVLDGFAGSGALAFEALSRGATHATLVERDAKAAALIASNAKRLGVADRVTVITADLFSAEQRLAGRQFGIVFLDPPYAAGVLADAIALIDRLDLLLPGGIVVAEHGSETALPQEIGSLTATDSRRYGAESFTFYTKAGNT